MKKLILPVIVLFVLSFANAQKVKIGITAGFDYKTLKVSGSGYTAPSPETGFYGGTFVDLTAAEKVHVQPEVLIVFVKDSKQLQFPILTKIFVVEKLGILVGPNVFFDLNKKIEGQKRAGLGFDFGGSYTVNKNFSIEAKYDLGLTNLIKNVPSGLNERVSGLFIGIANKF